MDDGAASTILNSDGGDRVTPSEARGDSHCPFSGETPFFDSLSSLCLHSSLNVSPAASEREREGDAQSAGRKPLKAYMMTHLPHSAQ